MKNLQTLLLTCLVACTLVLTACGNKNASQSEPAAEKGEKMMDMLMKADGASAEEMAQVKCMMNLTAKLGSLKSKLTSEHKSFLREQFELLEDSPEECQKTLDTLNKFEIEIKSKELLVPKEENSN